MAKSKKMEFDYVISSYLAYRHAQDFLKSAKIIDENGILKPTIVNIAFSCELFMKALITWRMKSQQIISEHKLENLFAMLEQGEQDRVKSEVGNAHWNEFLADSSDTFRSWRYFYEKDNVMFGHVGWLFDFAESLERICSETISLDGYKFEK